MSKKEKNALNLLKGAYNLSTPDDNRKYYEGFAPFYDSVFVKDLGYTYPSAVAKLLLKKIKIDGPICDIGCGTGLVASEIKKKAPNAIIDGVDISKDMIQISREKNIYRNLLELNLEDPLDHLLKNYSAVVSAGTFTHGHLGSDALKRLVSHFEFGTKFVIGINFDHYHSKGFEKKFKTLVKSNIIESFESSEVYVYNKDNEELNIKNSKACVCLFSKT
jgi:SAM-dependent methyltransferase